MGDFFRLPIKNPTKAPNVEVVENREQKNDAKETSVGNPTHQTDVALEASILRHIVPHPTSRASEELVPSVAALLTQANCGPPGALVGAVVVDPKAGDGQAAARKPHVVLAGIR